jgi:hypothetical protein
MTLVTALDIVRCVLDGPVVGAVELDRVAQLLDEAELPALADDEYDLRFQREAISDIFTCLAGLRRCGDLRGRMPEAARRRRIETYGYVYEGTLNALLDQARLCGGPEGRAWALEAYALMFEDLPRAEQERILET